MEVQVTSRARRMLLERHPQADFTLLARREYEGGCGCGVQYELVPKDRDATLPALDGASPAVESTLDVRETGATLVLDYVPITGFRLSSDQEVLAPKVRLASSQ